MTNTRLNLVHAELENNNGISWPNPAKRRQTKDAGNYRYWSKYVVESYRPIAAAGAASFKFAADLQDAFSATEQVYKALPML